MERYNILQEGEHFFRINNELINTKGTRDKHVVIDNNQKVAFFKYYKYNCRELCSEKICYEIAKVLNFECAEVELAKDIHGNIGILNYRFVDPRIGEEHTDILEYLSNSGKDRKKFYSLINVIQCLDELNPDLIKKFIQIMIFDALVGETDRHEENWGMTKKDKKIMISPLYDNGSNLLWQCDENKLLEFEKSIDKFKQYIMRSSSCLYDINGHKYKHFDLIKLLNDKYHLEVVEILEKLKKLSDKEICRIVSMIPEPLCQ